MKKLVKLLIAFCITHVANGQSNLSLYSLKNPVYTGDRELTFNVNGSGNNFEVWVFYSSNQSDLNNINASSATSGTLTYGRATMVQEGNHVICHFIFPHEKHPSIPNRHYFELSLLSQVPGLIQVSGFSVLQSLLGFGMQNPSNVVFDKNPKKYNKNQCVYYKVLKKVKIVGVGNFTEVSTLRKFVMPDAFTIGIAGDSYASGEGAPMDDHELLGNNNDMWSACNCHRSTKSGLLRGVKKFIHKFPEVAIDYSFAACSGAITDHLIGNTQTNSNNTIPNAACGTTANPIQFETIKKQLITDDGHDKLNMLIMNIGGNNTGFADVVTNFLVLPRNLALESLLHDPLADYVSNINGLDEDYEEIDSKIGEIFNESNPFVAICTYPNPTKGKNGRCGCSGVLMSPDEIYDYRCAQYENSCGNSPKAEYEIISDRFVTPLNNAVRENTRFGWNIIEIENEAGSHGLCNCDDPYYNGTVPTSIASQGDPWGMVHPNSKGYDEMYTDKVFSFVNSKYQQFKLNYAVGVLLGIIPPPPPCESGLRLVKFDALQFLTLNIQAINKIPELSFISASIQDKDLNNLLEKGDENEIEKSAAFKKLTTDVNYKNTFKNTKDANYLYKPKTYVPKTFIKKKTLGVSITKLKLENEAYTKTPSYKKDELEAQKIKPQIKVYSNPLDNLYNR